MENYSNNDSSYDLSSHASDDDDSNSSLSINFVKKWPETFRNSVQLVRDAQIDIKHFRLERNGNEMEAELVDREIELQAEIRDITSETTDLRLQVSNLETELSQIQEQRTHDIISIRTSLANQLKVYQSEMTDFERTIQLLQDAIEAQRENHERNKDMLNTNKSSGESALDTEIEMLKAEIERTRKSSISLASKSSSDMTDAETTISLLNSEIESAQTEYEKISNKRQEFQRNLSILKRELIVEEEEAAALHNQVVKNSQLRAKMKGAIERVRLHIWKVNSASFQYL